MAEYPALLILNFFVKNTTSNNHLAELDALNKQLATTQLLLEKVAKKNELS